MSLSLSLFDDSLFPFPSLGIDKTYGLHLTPESKGGNAHSLMNMPHAFDVFEHEDKFQLVSDAPGMTPDEVKIELNEGVLSVSGSHEEAKYVDSAPPKKKKKKGEEGGKTGRRVIRSERKSYQFSRSFTLPETADPDAITADLDKGVLTVSIAKRPEPAKPEPNRIQVNASA
eukprot:gene1945-33356_t